MPAYPREELEEMMQRWTQANAESGRGGDWSRMAGFFSEDALYTWNNGGKYEFVARGRDQIRDWAFGTEMSGLAGWSYPYIRVLIDDVQGEVVGFWRQIAPVNRPDGTPYEVVGTGGSWFRYAGNYQWSWQRDFFDHANAGACFLEMLKNDRLSEGMQDRLKKGSKMPGWTLRSEFDWLPTVTPPG
jgi:hypothetical protein